MEWNNKLNTRLEKHNISDISVSPFPPPNTSPRPPQPYFILFLNSLPCYHFSHKLERLFYYTYAYQNIPVKNWKDLLFRYKTDRTPNQAPGIQIPFQQLAQTFCPDTPSPVALGHTSLLVRCALGVRFTGHGKMHSVHSLRWCNFSPLSVKEVNCIHYISHF